MRETRKKREKPARLKGEDRAKTEKDRGVEGNKGSQRTEDHISKTHERREGQRKEGKRHKGGKEREGRRRGTGRGERRRKTDRYRCYIGEKREVLRRQTD